PLGPRPIPGAHTGVGKLRHGDRAAHDEILAGLHVDAHLDDEIRIQLQILLVHDFALLFQFLMVLVYTIRAQKCRGAQKSRQPCGAACLCIGNYSTIISAALYRSPQLMQTTRSPCPAFCLTHSAAPSNPSTTTLPGSFAASCSERTLPSSASRPPITGSSTTWSAWESTSAKSFISILVRL